MRSLLMLLAIGAMLYLAACGAVFMLQRSMIYYPQPAWGPASERIGLSADGAQLVVSVRQRRGPGAVIYFGGNAEDVSASMPEMAPGFPDRAVYAMHYRGYGGSTGTPTEQALIGDALLLFDRVHAEHPDIIVMGRSLGSGIAVRLATLRPVARLVLVTPYDSLSALAAALFPYLPVRWLLRDTYDSAGCAPQVKAPTLLLAAQHDEVIPASNTERLYLRFPRGVATLKTIPGTGHNTISDSPAYLAALRGL